jgi:hypothetical protein
MRRCDSLRPIVLPVCLLVTGCAYNEQQRVHDETADTPPRNGEYSDAFRDRFDTHVTAYIEFDEQGDFWDRRQLASAVEAIRNARPPVLLAVYAHGWQNHSQSADVNRFNGRLLAKLASTPPIKGNYTVVGVYLGWNGKKLHGRTRSSLWKATEVGTPFTFWGRKNAAANRVGGTSVTEAIFSVARAARERSQGSKVLMIGHSFGALVMERAVSQAMIGALMFQNIETGEDKSVVLPADLVVLVNSAAESIYAKQMIDFFRSNPQGSRSEENYIGPDRPLVVSVTASADTATGVAFPIGTNISNLGGTFRDYESSDGRTIGQRQFLTTTSGHNETLASHRIVPAGRDYPLRGGGAFENNLEYPREGVFATTPDDWWRVERTGNPYNRTPYWIVHVPKEISGGHTDVWNARVMDTMAAAFRMAHPRLTAAPARMMLRRVPMVEGAAQ